MSPFLLPALVCAVITVIHVFAGGREVVPPLLAAKDLPPEVKFLHYYCWHAVSITLVGMTGAYAYAALASDGRVLAIFATLLAGALSLWCLALVLWKQQRHRDLPQWLIFAILTASGAWALAV